MLGLGWSLVVKLRKILKISKIQNGRNYHVSAKLYQSQGNNSTTILSQYSHSKSLLTTIELAKGVLEGKRSAIAKSITLVESSKKDDRIQAYHLIKYVTQARAEKEKLSTFRVGISGPPGAGKSTFIEALGTYLVPNNNVAVLAIDPSSYVSGGSILGDATRMTNLAHHPNAYIRGSPSRGTLGGVGRNTHEAIVLCESAGYNIVFVETVGVGQSETVVHDMVDMFVLLVSTGAGDELQGIKKGIVELADIILVNKSDGDLAVAARHTKTDYMSAVKVLRQKYEFWKPPVMACSSVTHDGIAEVWDTLTKFRKLMESTGEKEKLRRTQQKQWMWRIAYEELMTSLKSHSRVRRKMTELESKVMQGTITPGWAADELIATFLLPEEDEKNNEQ